MKRMITLAIRGRMSVRYAELIGGIIASFQTTKNVRHILLLERLIHINTFVKSEDWIRLMNMSDVNKKRPRIMRLQKVKRDGSEQKSHLAYEADNGTVMKIVDGQKHILLDTKSCKARNTRSKQANPVRIAEALQIMHSYGYPIKTAKEKQNALNDYRKINKRATRKKHDLLQARDTAVYSSINRDQFPKAGSGFKVVFCGIETNRKKH